MLLAAIMALVLVATVPALAQQNGQPDPGNGDCLKAVDSSDGSIVFAPEPAKILLGGGSLTRADDPGCWEISVPAADDGSSGYRAYKN